MEKKGTEMGINVMIYAALALAVLVVLFMIFTSEAGVFSKSALTCEAKGGRCVAKDDCQYQATNFKCSTKEMPICCVNPLER